MSSLFHRARFSLDHRWTPRHVSDHLDGELAAAARLRLEHHVAECELCRLLLADLRQMLGALQRLPALAGGRDSTRIAASVRRRLREPPAR